MNEPATRRRRRGDRRDIGGDMAATDQQPHTLESMEELDQRVRALMGKQAACDVNALHEERITFGEHSADVIASRAGSWAFIWSFLGVLALWMGLNVVAFTYHWDPYPFILLNLVLSCVAALQAPLILMSQKRQEGRDRLRAESDYQVNVKAEVLLEHLTEEIEILKLMVGGGETAQRRAPAQDEPAVR
jgi:uncharacterized membrane protein